VLAGVAAGLLRASEGSKYAGWGAGLVGCSLLAAGLARLVLPPRLSGLLSSRAGIRGVRRRGARGRADTAAMSGSG
jgi:hypothetical protein